MTGYQDPTNPMQQTLQPPKKGWFARSWWWFLPLIILGPILCCCGTCGGLTYFGLGEIEKMPPFVDGAAACESSNAVEALIGSPVEVGGAWAAMTSGGDIQANASNNRSTFSADLPVTGSTGSGRLYIEAESTNGTTWVYQVLEFEDDATSTTVDLLGSSGITPDPGMFPNGVDSTPDDADDGDESAE